MEPVKYQRSEPSVRLLNEIDILLTQVRLAELYLKQAQAAAADQVARIHERYESQLEVLRAAISQKEPSLDESSVSVAATKHLHLQIQDLQAHLEEHRRLLEQRDGDFQRVTAELVTSRSQINQLQLANDEALTAARDAERVRQDLQTELGKLRDEIAQKTLDLQQHRSAARESEQLLQDQLRRLQDELGREQTRVSAKDTDLEHARAEFQARLQESEALLEETNRQLEERRAAFAKVERDLQDRLNESDEQLRRKQAFLDESESELQKSRANLAALQSRITGLETDIAQAEAFKHETQRVHAALENDIAALRERAEQLDLLQKQTERLLAVQAEQIRQRVRAELEDLDALLASKDRELQAVRESAAKALAEQQAKSHSLEERMIAQAEDFNNRLAEQQRLLESREDALARAKEEFSNRLQQKDDSLKAKLAELRQVAENRATELDHATSEIQRLLGRIDQLETAAAHAEAMSPVEQITQLYQTQIAELRAEIERKSAELEEQGAARNDMVRTYRAELSRLRAESQEKPMPLDSRNQELLDGKNAMESLRERLTQLETAAAQAEQTGAEDRNRLRAEYEAQLAALREELNRRESAPDER